MLNKNTENFLIDIDTCGEEYTLLTDEDARKCFKERPRNCNKGDFGYIALVGGSLEYSGAIRLAAMANCAARSGAGVVTVAVPKDIAYLIAENVLECTVYPLADQSFENPFENPFALKIAAQNSDDACVSNASKDTVLNSGDARASDASKDTVLNSDEACASDKGATKKLQTGDIVAFELQPLCGKYKTIAIGMGMGTSELAKARLLYLLEHYKGTLIVDADGLNIMARLGINNREKQSDRNSISKSLVYTSERTIETQPSGENCQGNINQCSPSNSPNIRENKPCKEKLFLNSKPNLVLDYVSEKSQSENSPFKTAAKLILTPHLKEFSRLSGLSIEEIQRNPIAAARGYASMHGCIVLLKGPTTVVTDGTKVYLVNRGCPGMATAGSGDVLSGCIAAIAAYNQENLLLATATAAYVCGKAGELTESKECSITMLASDTARAINEIVKQYE